MLNSEERTYRFVVRFMMMLIAVMSFTIVSQAIAQVVGGAPLAAPGDLAQAASKIGWLSGLMVVLLQLAKSEVLGAYFSKISPSYQPAVVLLLGQLGALVEMVASGKPLGHAAIEWLLVSGNAMALYTVVVKPFSRKKKG